MHCTPTKILPDGPIIPNERKRYDTFHFTHTHTTLHTHTHIRTREREKERERERKREREREKQRLNQSFNLKYYLPFNYI